jgi:hypothetical protein
LTFSREHQATLHNIFPSHTIVLYLITQADPLAFRRVRHSTLQSKEIGANLSQYYTCFGIGVCIPMESQVATLGIARFFIHWIHVQVHYTSLINLNDFLKVVYTS